MLCQYRWVGGLACDVRSDMRKELGPQLKDLEKGEVILLDGGFPGRKHQIVPPLQSPPLMLGRPPFKGGGCTTQCSTKTAAIPI